MRNEGESRLRRLPVFALLLSTSGVLLGTSSAVDAAAEERRDPFVNPREVVNERAKSVLVGVLVGRPPLAIIGEQVVSEGDRIDGWQVVEVRLDGVLIERNGRREIVPVGALLPAD